DDDVYEAWDKAISARAENEPAFELLRIKKAEIESADLEGTTARVAVRYDAELGDGEMVRTAREIWTFMRDVSSSDPNWILDDVEEAN
ncbi:MAG: TIM44-like domain-containing protein, partial [Hyphomonas sp.]|nr:TIM44-like domain-containing protein [Hyphomonas sp.]